MITERFPHEDNVDGIFGGFSHEDNIDVISGLFLHKHTKTLYHYDIEEWKG